MEWSQGIAVVLAYIIEDFDTQDELDVLLELIPKSNRERGQHNDMEEEQTVG